MIINIKMLDIISSDIRDFCPESKKHINKFVAILTALKKYDIRMAAESRTK